MVRNVFRLDRKTHRHLIEPLSRCLHLKTTLSSRFVKFYRSLISSNKFTIRFLARLQERDLRTSFGINLDYLRKACRLSEQQLDLITPGLVKKCVIYAPVCSDNIWKNTLAQELLSTRNNDLYVCGFSDDEIESILSFVCTN